MTEENAERTIQAVQIATAAERTADEARRDLGHRLDDLAEQVRTRLRRERAADVQSFAGLGEVITRDSLLDPLRRATGLGLIDLPPPMVRVSEAEDLFVSIDYRTQSRFGEVISEDLSFSVRDSRGRSLGDSIDWDDSASANEVMVAVGRELASYVSATETEEFDVKGFFDGLSDLLTVAYNQSELRPVVALCRPGWAVTSQGVGAIGRNYPVRVEDLRANPNWSQQIAGKPWGDVNSFDRASALAQLVLPRRLSSWAPGDPPF